MSACKHPKDMREAIWIPDNALWGSSGYWRHWCQVCGSLEDERGRWMKPKGKKRSKP